MNSQPAFSITQRLDCIRMDESDRRSAEAWLRAGELVGGLFFRAGAHVKSAVAPVSKSYRRYRQGTYQRKTEAELRYEDRLDQVRVRE